MTTFFQKKSPLLRGDYQKGHKKRKNLKIHALLPYWGRGDATAYGTLHYWGHTTAYGTRFRTGDDRRQGDVRRQGHRREGRIGRGPNDPRCGPWAAHPS